MRVSYSRVSTFTQCPQKYWLRYDRGFNTIFNCDPMNPLTIGTALHSCIEKSIDQGIAEYFAAYPVVKDLNIHEQMKLEALVPKAVKLLPKGEHEVQIVHPDFTGFIDLLVQVGENEYDVYDFKYSNNLDNYLASPQLHLYKYFFELTNPGKKVRSLFYLMVPKTMIRQKKTEDLYQFRQRLLQTLEAMEPGVIEVEYDPSKVIDFLIDTKHCVEADSFPKNETRLCEWCEYKDYCKEGDTIMLLPKNERRKKEIDLTPDMWIYADSYVGKSTFVDKLDNVIFANTDGNTRNITSPFIRIADEVTVNGRMTERKMAWEVFKEFVAELEKKENDFEVVALDLLEDLYEHCRLYVYNKLGIQHEQDAGFGKGWDMVRTEFCSTIKRLKSLGYQMVYISKELKTEVTLKSGAKYTTYQPNLPEKVANILAGTVTLTMRAYMDEDGRFLQLKKKENVFGGGRFDFVNATCPLDMEAFKQELALAQGEEKPARKAKKKEEPVKAEEPAKAEEPTVVEEPAAEEAPAEEEVPKRRRRRKAE